MKMKRFVIVLLLVAILAALPVSAADRKLTMDRAIAINDTQVIIEFSEPIAINKFDSNYGPFISIRYVNSSGGVYKINDDKSPYYGTYLQWTGTVQYVDSKHDRILFTVMSSVFGVDTLSGIRNYEGILADFSQCKVVMSLEEVPYDTEGHYVDNAIGNVTTRDGEVYLSPTRFNGYESCNIPIEINFNYRVDLSAPEDTAEKSEITWEGSLVALADGTEMDDEMTEEKPVVDVLKNDPLIVAAILGGSALVCAVLIVIAVVIGKKRKAV